MKINFFAVFFSLFFATQFAAQQWETRSNMPTLGRDDGVAFSLGSAGYVVTGNQGGFSESNRLWCYNPIQDQWDEKASFPGEYRQYAGAFVIGDKAYILGGISPVGTILKDVWEYAAHADQWKQLNDFPGEARFSFFAISNHKNGFIGTGSQADTLAKDCWKYTPETDHWSPITDYPGGRVRDAVACYVAGALFVGCGFSFNPLTFYRDFYRYAPETDTWVSIAPFPGEGRGYACAQGDGMTAVVGGGWGENDLFFSDHYLLDRDGRWEKIIQNTASGIRGRSAFTIGFGIYFVSGLTEDLIRSNALHLLQLPPEKRPLLYPNPTSHQSHVASNPFASVRVLDLNGQQVESGRADAKGNYVLQIRPKSTYLVEVVPVENYPQLRYTLKWVVR